MRWLILMIVGYALAGCGSKPNEHKTGSFVFADGFTDSYSSATSIYHRLNCKRERPFIDVHVRLTDAEISSILSEADDIDFYHLPKNVVGTSDPPRAEIMPCMEYRLHMASGSQHNDVSWSCGYEGAEDAPQQIAPLISLIRKTLQSKSEVRGLPKSACMFM